MIVGWSLFDGHRHRPSASLTRCPPGVSWRPRAGDLQPQLTRGCPLGGLREGPPDPCLSTWFDLCVMPPSVFGVGPDIAHSSAQNAARPSWQSRALMKVQGMPKRPIRSAVARFCICPAAAKPVRFRLARLAESLAAAFNVSVALLGAVRFPCPVPGFGAEGATHRPG